MGTTTMRDEREYDSGYRDGRAGLSWISGESCAYYRGFHAGATSRKLADACADVVYAIDAPRVLG